MGETIQRLKYLIWVALLVSLICAGFGSWYKQYQPENPLGDQWWELVILWDAIAVLTFAGLRFLPQD